MALAALVLSMTGTATGLRGKNNIDRNDLGKRVVKAVNIQKNAVRGYQLAENAAGGFQVNEDTLGTVPNAARLNGLEPSAFARSLAGRGRQNDVGVQTAFTDQPSGFAVETDGVADAQDSIVIRKLDGGSFGLFTSGGASVEFGSTEIVDNGGGDYDSDPGSVVAYVNGDNSRRLQVRCLFAVTVFSCWGFPEPS